MNLSEEKEDEFFSALGSLCDRIGVEKVYRQYNTFNLKVAVLEEDFDKEMKSKIGWFQYYCDQFFGANEDG